jgi:hypothetical protein
MKCLENGRRWIYSMKISPVSKINATTRIDMIKMAIILISLSLLAFGAFLVPAAFAQCSTCHGGENWDAAQKLDEIGNPSAQTASTPLWGPAAARLTNSQFEKNASEGTANKEMAASSNAASSNAAQMPESGIDLKNISANPDPASPGSPVSITAILGENMTAYALITNSIGVQVANVTLEHTSGDEYVGAWTASIATGLYNATIVASASGASRTFADALQIVVKGSSDTASSALSYKKLG